MSWSRQARPAVGRPPEGPTTACATREWTASPRRARGDRSDSGLEIRDGGVTPRRDSALVVLHGGRVAHRRVVGVLPELTPGVALAQQVPQLVELDLDPAELLMLFLLADLAPGEALAQGALGGDQIGDVLPDVDVGGHALTVPVSS